MSEFGLLASAAAEAAVDDVLLSFISGSNKYALSGGGGGGGTHDTNGSSDSRSGNYGTYEAGGDSCLNTTALLQRADDLEERLKRHEKLAHAPAPKATNGSPPQPPRAPWGGGEGGRQHHFKVIGGRVCVQDFCCCVHFCSSGQSGKK